MDLSQLCVKSAIVTLAETITRWTIRSSRRGGTAQSEPYTPRVVIITQTIDHTDGR